MLKTHGMLLLNNFAGIAQLVERNLAKVEVASSNLVSRSTFNFQRFNFYSQNCNSIDSIKVLNNYHMN